MRVSGFSLFTEYGNSQRELTDRRFLPVWSCADGHRVKNDGFPVNVGLPAGHKHACFVCDGAKLNH